MANIPLYKRIRAQLTNSLVAGEWLPGTALPSESKLAERYKVGISTIRAAVRELELANVLVRAQGRGTFVTRFEDRANPHKFLNVVRQDGTQVDPHRRMLKFERIDAPAEIAEALQLPRSVRESKVFRLTYVISFTDEPIYLATAVLPAGLFPGLRRSWIPDGCKSLYSIYQERFGVCVTSVVDSIAATSAPKTVAKACNIRLGTPILGLKRVSYAYNGRPVDVRYHSMKTMQHCYRIEQGKTD